MVKLQSIKQKCRLLILGFLAVFGFKNASAENIAPYVSNINASYTAAWNKLSAINNGVIGYAPIAGGTIGNDQTWGSWSESRPESQWLEYEWSSSFTINQVTVYYWVDKIELSGTGSNVAVPASWIIQYDNAGTWTDVTLLDGESYSCNNTAPNTVKFNDVTTSKLRLFMNAQSNGTTYAALGVIEWQVESNGSLAELQTQTDELAIGYADGENADGVTSKLTLPVQVGTKGVKVRWESDKPTLVDTLGNVNRPATYDKKVTLTANLSLDVNGTIYTNKKVFVLKVLGITGTPLEIAQWNFNSDNISVSNDTVYVTDNKSGFKGKLMNEAKLRTIGKPDGQQFKVLDLGNNTGYFDMGQEIGKAIYVLSDHTIMGYFRVNEMNTDLGNNGNYYWNFSNSESINTNPIGFMYGRLNAQAAGLSAAGSPSIATSAGFAATKGGWHHFAYTLNGTTGTVYIDGIEMGQNSNMLIPSATLPKQHLDGTPYNWLGRSSWTTDTYLKQTLLYDFRIMSVPLSADDLNAGFEGFDGVTTTLDNLNIAYANDSDYISPALVAEQENLSLGDLSAVTSDVTLPTAGTLNPNISISWSSSLPQILSSTGVVNRPSYFNTNVTLTAIMKLENEFLTKTFPATVLVAPGTEFTSDLLAKFDFSTVSGATVTDVAEKQFQGTLKNDATIKTMGNNSTGIYNVLSLGDSIGYFDMGEEIGKVMYHLDDYTIGAFYRVDTAYANIADAGNFLWNFSNSADAGTDRNGYVIGSLSNQSHSISTNYFGTGNQSVTMASTALKGEWHHLAYSQNGTIGTLYVDGIMVNSGVVSNLPSNSLPRNGKLGTIFNWIGRSCYTADAYLRKTLVYDFRLYKTALSDSDIYDEGKMNVAATIAALNNAYSAGISGVKKISNSPYKITVNSGTIQINGLNGSEIVSIYDISGRKLKNAHNMNEYQVGQGIYIIRINGYATKVIVK
ncbi:MAG: hypothetical protein PHS59_11510 [Paludibacter sp.]|nr:hypothetical protein [Paludibacter sp.]